MMMEVLLQPVLEKKIKELKEEKKKKYSANVTIFLKFTDELIHFLMTGILPLKLIKAVTIYFG